MSQQPKYRFYATLLDAYRNVVESEEVWLTYWGNSAEPPHTPEQFHLLQVEGFINGLNRLESEPSEAASKGTAFNELVDSLVDWRAPNVDNIEKVRDEDGNVMFINCELDGFKFSFPYHTVKYLADYYKDAVTQYLTKGVLQTSLGLVELYGYIDELMPNSIHDVKTTSRYEFPKFRKHAQHLVYPYCLAQEGSDIRHFQYDVVVWNKYGAPETHSEIYIYDPNRDIPVLRQWCEDLIGFIELYRPLITECKLFGGNKEDSPIPTPLHEVDTTGMPMHCQLLVQDIIKNHKLLGI